MNLSTGRKVLLLTGASGKLGGAIMDLLGDQLDVIAVMHRTKLRGATVEVASFDPSSGQTAHRPVRSITCDLTSQEDLTRTMRMISELGIAVDYVVNGAADARFLGGTTDAFLLAEDARQQFELNVIAPAMICSVLFHHQWKTVPVSMQQASILNVSSLSGVQAFVGSGQGFYAASKAALNMLTMHMAAEYGPYGIRVNALAPNRFSNEVETKIVASNALRILSEGVTGRVFSIGD